MRTEERFSGLGILFLSAGIALAGCGDATAGKPAGIVTDDGTHSVVIPTLAELEGTWRYYCAEEYEEGGERIGEESEKVVTFLEDGGFYETWKFTDHYADSANDTVQTSLYRGTIAPSPEGIAAWNYTDETYDHGPGVRIDEIEDWGSFGKTEEALLVIVDGTLFFGFAYRKVSGGAGFEGVWQRDYVTRLQGETPEYERARMTIGATGITSELFSSSTGDFSGMTPQFTTVYDYYLTDGNSMNITLPGQSLTMRFIHSGSFLVFGDFQGSPVRETGFNRL